MSEEPPAGSAERSRLVGTAATTLAFLFWGATMAYWRALRHVDALEIIAHRVLWSLGVTVLLLTASRRWGALRRGLRPRRAAAALLISAGLLATNWLVYVWGINHERILETSMGYFMAPLANVALGRGLLGERLRPMQIVSFLLAAAGVAHLAMAGRHEHLPWVALTLAGTFALYGLIRKTARLESLPGLAAEAGVLTLPAAAFLGWLALDGRGALGRADLATPLFLMGAGVVTAVPLLLFAYGARRIRLTAVGFLQYLAPTCTLLLGVFVFHEPLGQAPAITFALIWAGLAVFTVDGLRSAARAPGADEPSGLEACGSQGSEGKQGIERK